MARTIAVARTCSAECPPNRTRHTLMLAGQTTEIGICSVHLADLREKLGPFIRYARKTSTQRNAATRRRSAAIRAWARQQFPGMPVAARGRLPKWLLDEYAAHQ